MYPNLSPSIFFYLFIYPGLFLSLSILFSLSYSIPCICTSIFFISLLIQIHAYRFQSPFLYLSLSLAYPCLSFFIFLSIQISFYHFHPSLLYLRLPFVYLREYFFVSLTIWFYFYPFRFLFFNPSSIPIDFSVSSCKSCQKWQIQKNCFAFRRCYLEFLRQPRIQSAIFLNTFEYFSIWRFFQGI